MRWTGMIGLSWRSGLSADFWATSSAGGQVTRAAFNAASILSVFLALILTSLSVSAATVDQVPSIASCMTKLAGMHGEPAASRANDLYGLPERLLVNLISRRENRAWDPMAVSKSGAAGLAQVKPIAVCSRIKGCDPNDKTRLGLIEQKLKGVAYGLCWGARILRENLRICSGDVACALGGYLNGEYTSRYISEVMGG